MKLYCGALTRMEFLEDGEVSVKVLPIVLWSISLEDARLEAHQVGLEKFGPDEPIRAHLVEVPKSVVFYNELPESEFSDFMVYPERER